MIVRGGGGREGYVRGPFNSSQKAIYTVTAFENPRLVRLAGRGSVMGRDGFQGGKKI